MHDHALKRRVYLFPEKPFMDAYATEGMAADSYPTSKDVIQTNRASHLFYLSHRISNH
jgi:hypothetical protein